LFISFILKRIGIYLVFDELVNGQNIRIRSNAKA
jgi:hypothetical protein